MEQRPKPPLEQIVAGDIIYWVCIIAAMLSMIGPVVSIAIPENNVANPYKVFDLVWEGKKSGEIWKQVTADGKFPGAHFWIHHITKGDGLTQFGAWLGCVCALCAIFPAGWVYLFKRVWGYWLISMWVSFMILFAMLGIIEMH